MRKLLLKIWRIWFYLLAGITFLVVSPLMAASLLFPDGYRYVFWLGKNIWARFTLLGMGFWVKTEFKTQLDPNQNYMFVANHSSFIDIMLMIWASKHPFVFVGKKELVKIPIFGSLYKRTAIMVDRTSSKSRYEVYKRAQEVLDKGYSVCIFPEKEYLDETVLLNSFKTGAFKIAIAHQLPICPMVFLDCKRKYPWGTSHGHPGLLRVSVLPPTATAGLKSEDALVLLQKTYDTIHTELLNDKKQAAVNAIKVWKRYNLN